MFCSSVVVCFLLSYLYHSRLNVVLSPCRNTAPLMSHDLNSRTRLSIFYLLLYLSVPATSSFSTFSRDTSIEVVLTVAISTRLCGSEDLRCASSWASYTYNSVELPGNWSQTEESLYCPFYVKSLQQARELGEDEASERLGRMGQSGASILPRKTVPCFYSSTLYRTLF
jgi:hypothetical protein